jgi:hypothetical protein
MKTARAQLFDLWQIFLVAELLLPSHFMGPLLATCVQAVFAGMHLAQETHIWNTFMTFMITGISFVVMIAFQKLHLNLACWLAMIMACPQPTMWHCRIGFFAIECKPVSEEWEPIAHHVFPLWWQWVHGCFLLMGLGLPSCIYFNGESHPEYYESSEWSWTGLFLCKGASLYCTDSGIQLVMDFKTSPRAIALLIAAPARWTKTSIAGLLTSVILTFTLPIEDKELWLTESSFREVLSMELLDNIILGLSFCGAWLAPWIASCVAAFLSSDAGFDGAFIDKFLDQLMPTTVTPLRRPCGASLHSQHSSETPLQFPGHLVPSGHLVLEATNIIAARRGQRDTLFDILRAEHPGVTMEQVLGPRSYARVKIGMDDENIVKEAIKSIARARGVRTTIKTVERVFYSPRD